MSISNIMHCVCKNVGMSLTLGICLQTVVSIEYEIIEQTRSLNLVSFYFQNCEYIIIVTMMSHFIDFY